MKEIIFEDKNYIICAKPAGMLVQSGRSFDNDLTSMLKTYLIKKEPESSVSVINRLDRPVEGLVLLAKNKQAAARASKELLNEESGKEYLAVICGKPDADSGEFVDYLARDGKTNLSSVVNKGVKDAKEAKLTFDVLETIEDEEYGILSLVRVKLHTGRHHQIRVQFASRGLGLYGDTKYNSIFRDRRGWFDVGLCCYRFTFGGQIYKIKPSGNIFDKFNTKINEELQRV